MTHHRPKHPEPRKVPKLVWRGYGVAITHVEVKPPMRDDTKIVIAILVMMALVGMACAGLDFHHHPRPQAKVIASRDDVKVPLGLHVPRDVVVPTILPPTVEIGAEPPADAPLAPNATTITTELPRLDELRPSVDIPAVPEPAHEDRDPQPAAVADAGREIEPAALPPVGIGPSHDDRHAGRRLHHLRHGRHHHRASEDWCEPLCDAFKATARLAGLI